MRRITTDYPDIVIPQDAVEEKTPIPAHFGNDQPLEVDVGSGKGRFILARAAEHPDTNYWGLDRQFGRILRTARKAHRLGLQNVRLARVDAVQGIESLLPDGSVTTFYIFFPDPWPKRRHHRRRLICPEFLDLLHRKMTASGCVHFATDHQDYGKVVSACFADDPRFIGIEPMQPAEEERTNFEILFTDQNKPICRLSVQKAGGCEKSSAT